MAPSNHLDARRWRRSERRHQIPQLLPDEVAVALQRAVQKSRAWKLIFNKGALYCELSEEQLRNAGSIQHNQLVRALHREGHPGLQ